MFSFGNLEKGKNFAAPPGFEPGHTDPESAVLPLHHGARKSFCQSEKIKGYFTVASENYFLERFSLAILL